MVGSHPPSEKEDDLTQNTVSTYIQNVDIGHCYMTTVQHVLPAYIDCTLTEYKYCMIIYYTRHMHYLHIITEHSTIKTLKAGPYRLTMTSSQATYIGLFRETLPVSPQFSSVVDLTLSCCPMAYVIVVLNLFYYIILLIQLFTICIFDAMTTVTPTLWVHAFHALCLWAQML